MANGSQSYAPTVGYDWNSPNPAPPAGTTRCERCPACLDKLDAVAAALAGKAAFVSCCLDDPDFGKELVEEHDWDHFVHCGLDPSLKEKAKAAWGFAQVPWLVVLDADGATVHSGSSLKATKASIEAWLAPAGKENAPDPAPAPAAVFTMDEDF